MDIMRFAAIANIPMLLAIMVPLWFLLVIPLQRRRKDREEKSLALATHIANISVLIALLVFCGLMPWAYDNDVDAQGMIFLDTGALSLVLAIALYLSSRQDPTCYKTYLWFRLTAHVIGGVGLFVAGIYWLLYLPELVLMRQTTFVSAIIALLLGEIHLLKRNNWQFLPRVLH